MPAAGTLDLSSVTDALIDAIKVAIDGSGLWTVNGGATTKYGIDVSGMPVDLARADSETRLSLSLIHVIPHPSYRTVTQRGPGGLTVPLNPIALALTYVLSAFSGKDYVHEQQAMSIALAWVAANPIQRFTVAANPPHQVECTMTIETANLDEMARLWQAFSGAMRLTALLKVGVVFLGPDPAPVVAVDPPEKVGMLVTPGDPRTVGPRLLAITEPVVMATGGANQGPLAPGETAIVAGLALEGPEKLFISNLDDSASHDVTAWVSGRRANSLRLTLPATVGAPPAAAPAPGRYKLRIGNAPGEGAAVVVEVGS